MSFQRQKYENSDASNVNVLIRKLNHNLDLESNHTHDGKTSLKVPVSREVIEIAESSSAWSSGGDGWIYTFGTFVENPILQFWYKDGGEWRCFNPTVRESGAKQYVIEVAIRRHIKIVCL